MSYYIAESHSGYLKLTEEIKHALNSLEVPSDLHSKWSVAILQWELVQEEMESFILKETEEKKCRWCGNTYDQHLDTASPNYPPRTPCGGLKSGFMEAK